MALSSASKPENRRHIATGFIRPLYTLEGNGDFWKGPQKRPQWWLNPDVLVRTVPF